MTAHLLFLVLALMPIAAGATTVAVMRERERRRPGVLLELLPPDGSRTDPRAWMQLFRSLFAISHPWWKRWAFGQPWIAFELASQDGNVSARCWTPARLERMVSVLAGNALPGLEIRRAEQLSGDPGLTSVTRTRLRLDVEPLHPLAENRPEPLRSVTGALAAAPSGEVQIAISPDVGWQKRARRRLDEIAGVPPERGLFADIAQSLVDGLFHLVLPPAGGAPARKSRAREHVDGTKAARPGYRAEIRLRIAAGSDGVAKASMHALVGAFRGFDGANGLRPTRVFFGKRFDAAVTARSAPGGAMILTAEELAGLFNLSSELPGFAPAPVKVHPARRPQTEGKVVCLLEDGSNTPARITQADCRQHMHVLGPTGSGKSTLLLNLALDDITAGRGVGVIDPKGDLVQALIERIPRSEWDRVAIVDPSLRDLPVGINVLSCDDPDLHDVVTDQVVAIFKKTYERFWGPRTDDLLRASILTLLQRPGATLCEVPLLLLQPEARQRFIKDIDDPVGLEPFWREFGGMTDGQRLQVVGPLLNKLRTFLLRRTVRNMLGQSRSTIAISEILDNNCILLVSLAKGLLGEETSQLLGAFLVSRIWQSVMARSSRPESWRPDFNLYLDEFQNYLHLPQSLEDVLAEARGYRLGLVLANQNLGQLPGSIREALAANARTRVVFQCGQEDARYLARECEPELGERQLRSLRRFQVAVRLNQGGHTERPFTGITQAMPASLGDLHAADLIKRSLERWGRPRVAVEAEIRSRLDDEGFTASDEEVAG